MNWTTFIHNVSERSGVSAKDARAVFAAAAGLIKEELSQGGSVPLRGVGTLRARWMGERVFRDIQSQRKMYLDGRYIPQFRPSQQLKSALLSRSPQHWRRPENQKAWRLSETLISDVAAYHFDKIPTDLTQGMSNEVAQECCAKALGPIWNQLVQTFQSQIPESVYSEHNYLIKAAVRWWAKE